MFRQNLSNLAYADWKSNFKQANNKNLQFLPNQADILAILPTHELIIFTKFQNDWVKIVDFSFQLFTTCA